MRKIASRVWLIALGYGGFVVWEGISSLLGMIVLMGVLLRGGRWLMHWNAVEEERRCPALSVRPQDVPQLAREAFGFICRCASGPDGPVDMSRYFEVRGWNEQDIRSIFESLCPVLVKRHSLFSRWYMPTERGLNVYGSSVMSEPSEQVNIWASGGGVVGGINIKSGGATAQVGSLNAASSQFATHQRVVEALRADAEGAEGLEADVAVAFADDLAEAVNAQDAGRVDQVLDRVRGLISTASSAFSLTREITGLLD
ncbi:hypothetical protein [Streptomyces sp. NBC_00932]|uniref:hypothetical protein n=1 Tax=Streptomyces sp. NBC_00932 TaxID=2903690 RepID=UPI00386C2FDC|nr:hypothetical protein OG221_20095 [Streptomyces sp. NBC_00932]